MYKDSTNSPYIRSSLIIIIATGSTQSISPGQIKPNQ